jgi:hypothetical protein
MAMTSSITGRAAPRELLAFTFPPGANFEGRLSTALQRIESGGALRILGALFVGRGESADELAAVELRGGSAGVIGNLIGFRLDDAERARQTEEALAGPSGAAVREIADALQPGEALAAVLLEHSWAQVLEDSVARIGGTALLDEHTPAEPEQAWPTLPARLAARPPDD